MQYLVETGVLLRLFDRTDPVHDDIRKGLQLLRQVGHSLAVSSQNIAEFWNVSTRPSSAVDTGKMLQPPNGEYNSLKKLEWYISKRQPAIKCGESSWQITPFRDWLSTIRDSWP